MDLSTCSVPNRKNVQNYVFKGEKFLSLGSPVFLLLYSLFLTMIFSCYMLHFSFRPSIKFTSKQDSAPHTNSLYFKLERKNEVPSLSFLLIYTFSFFMYEESPIDMYKDAEDKFRTWLFPRHNFTLMVLRTEFLVFATERVINGSFRDYVIFSDGHWFLRLNYLYENDNLIGCVYCGEAGVQDLGPGYAIRRAFQAAFNYINKCLQCSGVVVLLRTFSAGQFEQGAWNEGGLCNRTRPFAREEVKIGDQDWEFRTIQIEEIERARKDGHKIGNTFEVMDVTRAMLMRPDGHPGAYWGNKWMKGYSDCIHWCLPGPIDTWNEFLLEILRKKLSTSN
ncbi:unnamed protein product [Withania somnifera]